MDTTKIESFIDQLLKSGAVKNLSFLEKEENLLTFISMNEPKLRATFNSSDYYPGENWDNVKFEILKKIGDKVGLLIKERLENIIRNSIIKLFEFPQPDTECRDKLITFVSKLLSKYQSRRIYGNIVTFIESNKLSSFISSIFENKRTIFRGLSKYDEIAIKTAEDAVDFVYTTLMLLPVFDISLPMKIVMPQSSGSNSVTFRETEGNKLLRTNFILKIKEIISKGIPEISTPYLELLTKTFYEFEEAENTPFTAKFSKIFYNILLEYKSIKQDKGADSFETSWLTVARTNYKFFAYDYYILDELYKISIEEGL